MPSMRRIRIFGVIVFSLVLYILYITNSARNSQSPDLYSRTKDALDRDKGTYHPHGPRKGSGKDDDDDTAIAFAMQSRLKEAEKAAKDNANAKAPNPPEGFNLEEKAKPVVEDIEVGKPTDDKNVAGRRKHSSAEKVVDNANAENRDVEQMMDILLKKAPIIIFSKSYCPHSKRAKDILLNKYTIIPAPFVVELDQHSMGQQLQAKLGEMTGRRTVPNVMVRGRSIGGGDDVAHLDETDTLIEKINSLGGKQIQQIKHV